jgi:hypothetical protein
MQKLSPSDPQDREPDRLPAAEADQVQAWQEIEEGRFMPRRIRGSDRGRKLG